MLKSGAREGYSRRSHSRAGLLVVQTALSVALLVGAGSFVRSLHNLTQLRMGYDADRVLYVGRVMRGTPLDSVGRINSRRTLLARAQALPEVETAAWVQTIPFRINSVATLTVPGIGSVARLGRFTYQAATPDYFRAMGTRILRGRPFTDADREGGPLVTVVSESMGRTLWPNADPLGQCVHMGGNAFPCSTVIGVAEDIVAESFESSERLHYYVPLEQFNPSAGSGMFLRLRGDVSRHRESIRKALQREMPGESYVTALQMSDWVDSAQRSWRLGATMFVAFGALALIVAAVGLYSVIAYDVTQRRHEMGVRVALGAQRGDILALVSRKGVLLAGGGVALGATVALTLSRFMQPLLFRTSATDPLVFGAAIAVMLVVALLASMIPAMRATRTDPNLVLRAE